jgi:hypothetical protein
MVDGVWPTILVGAVGGLISQVIYIATALRANKAPTRLELLGSLLLAFLGAGAVLYGTDERSFLETATLGAAFPLLFGSAVRAITEAPPSGGVLGSKRHRSRTVLDWISGRVHGS